MDNVCRYDDTMMTMILKTMMVATARPKSWCRFRLVCHVHSYRPSDWPLAIQLWAHLWMSGRSLQFGCLLQNIWISYALEILFMEKTWSHGAGSKSKVGSKIRKYDLGFGPSNCWLPGSLQLQHFLSRALEKMDPLEISYDSMWSHGVSYGNGDPNSGFNGDPGTSV